MWQAADSHEDGLSWRDGVTSYARPSFLRLGLKAFRRIALKRASLGLSSRSVVYVREQKRGEQQQD